VNGHGDPGGDWLLYIFNSTRKQYSRFGLKPDPPLDDSGWPGDWQLTFIRFDAARVAARAIAGQGKDAGEVDEPRRVQLRCQALKWLQDDLSWWSHIANIKWFDHWRQLPRTILLERLRDPWLASLRDPDVLAKLPADEAESWRKLWADVERLQKKMPG
jgi:hypothetical protein